MDRVVYAYDCPEEALQVASEQRWSQVLPDCRQDGRPSAADCSVDGGRAARPGRDAARHFGFGARPGRRSSV